jgi:uncharacterized protein YciI
MKFFIIEGTFNTPILVDKVTLDKALKDHFNHLQMGHDDGRILATGPKIDTGGGVIIMKANSLDEVENYFSIDPLKVSNIQEYRIVEFKLHECQPLVKEWFDI